ncbi:hypothetical protein J2X37_001991 [Croceicoccus sp. BE223]|nr:hypothetical protein [Croceicoccus sp. BE223]
MAANLTARAAAEANSMTSSDKDALKAQLDKFKEAARELECDDDEQHFKDRLSRITKVSRQAKNRKP